MVEIDYTSFDDFGFSVVTAYHGISVFIPPPPLFLFVSPSFLRVFLCPVFSHGCHIMACVLIGAAQGSRVLSGQDLG